MGGPRALDGVAASPSASATETPSPSPTASAAGQSAAGQSATTTTSPDTGPTILRNVAWPADTTFGTAFLSNYASPDQIAIAPSSALTPAEEVTFTSYARVNIDTSTGETATDGTGARTLAQQADLASILSWNASGGDELDAEQTLTAITAIIARERPSSSRTVFAAAARGTAVNESLTKRINALFSPRWVSALSFTEMSTSEPTDVDRQTVGAGTLDADISSAITAMASSLTMLEPLANATDDPDAVYDSVTPQILPALSAQLTPSEQLDSATAMTSQVTGMLSAVTVEPPRPSTSSTSPRTSPSSCVITCPGRCASASPSCPTTRDCAPPRRSTKLWPRRVPRPSRSQSARSAVATSR